MRVRAGRRGVHGVFKLHGVRRRCAALSGRRRSCGSFEAGGNVCVDKIKHTGHEHVRSLGGTSKNPMVREVTKWS